MQSLPGVPLQVDFAVINKATGNFSETMKLGKGGFGAVYGCTLPAPVSTSRTTTVAAVAGQDMTMKVAVKKFTRDLSDRRYEDFLAEVSIINRLRHKNVVPLVGWSYNKGEPYSYTNTWRMAAWTSISSTAVPPAAIGGEQKPLGNGTPTTALLGT